MKLSSLMASLEWLPRILDSLLPRGNNNSKKERKKAYSCRHFNACGSLHHMWLIASLSRNPFRKDKKKRNDSLVLWHKESTKYPSKVEKAKKA